MKKIYYSFILALVATVGMAQNALDFDGSNDYVQTSFPGVLGSADRTFEAWVYVPTGITANNCIMD